MKSWFLKRSYPEHLIDTEMKKVKFKSREKTEKSISKGVPFVVTYHPSLNCLHKIIRDNTYLLYMNEVVKNLFLPGPMVSFRGARKLSSYLVRAKLYPLHRKVGSKNCAKNRCEVCDYVTDTDTFTSTVTGESFKINHPLNCDDRCIIYACNVRNNILGKLPMILDIDGTFISPTLESLIGKSLACKNIFIDILVVQVTGDSLMMYQLH